ncbi:hypothetical protein DYB30_010902 [Aphanomyces astaci]|uniref:Uncharacterized protein n=2 Tax=Aphanomyces astaci TaxID=112090 RepID=A0A397EB98_APHAT|nr:hypothetical protein DYB30_010902 [Aphanomyces astaci]RHZ13615.1 hypothetical protein DYB31_007040 [Aphanomyces astaci]
MGRRHSPPNVVVHAEATLHLHASRKSIQLLFPHLLNNEALTYPNAGNDSPCILFVPLTRCNYGTTY